MNTKTKKVTSSQAQRVYPENLLCGIFGIKDGIYVSKENIDGLEDGLKTLSDKEQYVLKEIWLNKKLLIEVGNELGLTKDRINQIGAKAIRKLRHPSKAKLMGEINEKNPKNPYLKRLLSVLNYSIEQNKISDGKIRVLTVQKDYENQTKILEDLKDILIKEILNQ